MSKQWFLKSVALLTSTAAFSAVLSAQVPQSPQSPRNAVLGTVNYVEGQVSLDGNPLNTRQNGKTQLQPNQSLTTGNGKVEMLLTPGVFVRVGNDSNIRMVSNGLANPTIEVVRGEITAGAVCGPLIWPGPMLSRRRGFTTATQPAPAPTPIGTLAGFGILILTCGPGCHGMDFSTARLDIRSSQRVMEGTPADSDTGADTRGLDMRGVVLRDGPVSVLPREAGSPKVVSGGGGFGGGGFHGGGGGGFHGGGGGRR
jgi:hypothetical protein